MVWTVLASDLMAYMSEATRNWHVQHWFSHCGCDTASFKWKINFLRGRCNRSSKKSIWLLDCCFREGVGCIEASFTILETINHMLERGSKVFSCFLDVRKAFDTVWIDGLLYKLFDDLGIKGRMWLAIKDLYTDVKAQVLYSGELSREFDVSQGTGQGRIFAPFMYKVYINSLLQKLSDHCYAISINSLSLPAPSFADDVTLLALFPSFLKTFLNICHQYSVIWRYEFNHTKSGVVTFGETKPIHSRLMKERDWTLGDTKVDELYEYKNLGVLKSYAGSFTSNILDNIEKTRKKAGMIFFLWFRSSQNKTFNLHQILEASMLTLSVIWCWTFIT